MLRVDPFAPKTTVYRTCSSSSWFSSLWFFVVVGLFLLVNGSDKLERCVNNGKYLTRETMEYELQE